mgnify:CR=1 FL=1
MSRYLQKKFALGRQGGKNLTRAIFACALTNIGLMLPVGLLFLFTQRLFGPLVGHGTPQMGLGGYVGTSVLILAVIFGLEYIQYVATFISSYAESADMRIRIAERLRKLPLSFFGKRDLADLTNDHVRLYICGNCVFPLYPGTYWSRPVNGADRRGTAGGRLADGPVGTVGGSGIVFSGGRYEAHGRSD